MGRATHASEETPGGSRLRPLGRFWRWGAGAVDRDAPATATPPPRPDQEPAPGRQLRDGRVRCGLSLREVSACTKIGLGHLENIEEENFARLPPRVYLKGFLLSFARAVRLPDPLAVTGAYLARFDESRTGSAPH